MFLKSSFHFLVLTPMLWGQLIMNCDLSQDYSVQPGDVVKGRLDLENAGSDSLTVVAYQTDYSFDADGNNYYGKPGSDPRSNASWIRYSPAHLTLSSRQKGVINYEIRVPDSTGLAGTFWSMIMVEETRPAEVETKGLIMIQSKYRYGVQISTTVGSTESGNIEVAFQNPVLDVLEEKKIFHVDIENKGNTLIRPAVWLEIFSPEGKSLGVFHANNERLYPETSRRFQFELQNLKAGTYKGILVADCGGEELFGANYTIQWTE